MKIPFSQSSLTHALRSLQYGPRIRPVRDWFVLLGIVFVLMLASVGINVWLLTTVERGEALGPAGAAMPALDKGPMEHARALFEKRVQEQDRYLEQYRFVDPSR